MAALSRAWKIALLYTAFAAIATLANLAVQSLILAFYNGPSDFLIAILLGTATGLPIKYLLDKRYIFQYRTESRLHDGKVFALYMLMSTLTTIVFWGVEYLFKLWFQDPVWTIVGGALGLSVGYFLKYRLDKKFVFVRSKK